MRWRVGASAFAIGVLLLAAWSATASATPSAFRLELSPTELTPADVPLLAGFLRGVEPSVPPRVQAALASTVRVSFDLRPEPSVPPLYREPSIAIPDCPRISSAPQRGGPAPSRPQELGVVETAGGPSQLPHIRLHRGFVSIIAQGPATAARYPCGHRTLYRLAIATLLHEVVHLYDVRTGLSQDPRYRHLQRFDRQGLWRRMASRNLLTERSPDPYESVSLTENLAVNAEFFLLDPEYRCRRPASYAFLESALHYRPFPHAPCEQNWDVYHRGQALRLDPSRIYQVHYLMAARGQGIASRFGHSMFRLVVCNAQRSQVGPECLDDVQDHIVLGFGANLQTDLQISAWKGLTGGYVSQLFVKPMPEILIEYTERGMRGLESFPLRFDRQELQQFVRRALEIYWSYEGRYYFLSNNCASESISLLKSASSSPSLHRISRIAPSGLRDDLLRLGLVDMPQFPAGAAGLLAKEQAGLYFPALLSRYESSYPALRALLPKDAPRTLRNYLQDTQAAQRRVWLDALHSAPAAQVLSASAQAFALEGIIQGQRFADLERQVARFVLRNLHTDRPLLQPLLQPLRLLLPKLGLELPWQQTTAGYGVPFANELRRPPDVDRDALTKQVWLAAQRIIQQTAEAERKEWQATQDNRRHLAQRVLELAAAVRSSSSQDRRWALAAPVSTEQPQPHPQNGESR